MQLKLDADGHVVVSEGKPVYVTDDGKEIAADYPTLVKKVGSLNHEAMTNREKLESALGKLKAFDGIEDPQAALSAIETVKNLDRKKLVDAGEIDKVKDEVSKAIKAQYEPVLAERDKLKSDLFQEKIGNAFSRSKFISEKVAIPADMLRATFGGNFKVEDGRITAYGVDGQKVYSQTHPGEVADFEEAMEIMVGAYPFRDQILKAPNASGDGKQPNKGGGGGSKTIRRREFEALDPSARSSKITEGFSVVD